MDQKLIYLQGKKNIVADALSRLTVNNNADEEIEYEQLLEFSFGARVTSQFL